MNTALSDAMRSAQLGTGGLATRVGVTRKTVERWLTDPLKIPHPRTSADVAEVLGVSETVLWPKAVRSSVKTGPEREILDAYPYRNACPSPVWSRLIDAAERRIVFAGYTNYFLWQEQPRLVERLQRKAENGCEVHVLVGDPESSVTRQREEIEDVTLTVSTRIGVTLDAL
ncbi:hypothetical protein [Streptomyces oceani]|uniref:hypothetical protein n=1 Tax=Streptomyces oceani TaxID=1075402 RepID=UPI000A7E4655